MEGIGEIRKKEGDKRDQKEGVDKRDQKEGGGGSMGNLSPGNPDGRNFQEAFARIGREQRRNALSLSHG